MIEFKRNKETGILEVWKDGKEIGDIITIGDKINEKDNTKTGKRTGKS